MNLLESLEQNSLVLNTKGGKYYHTSYNSNLDLYAGISRFNTNKEIINSFSAAYNENRVLALANLLYFLDIK